MEVDLKQDLFEVTFDPALSTMKQMLATIRQCGFEGKVVQAMGGATAPPAAVRRDLSELPDALAELVAKAKRDNKPLLLAFHGPG